MNRFAKLVQRLSIIGAVIWLLSATFGCSNRESGQVGSISIDPSTRLVPGQQATVKIEERGLKKDRVIQWSADKGSFASEIDQASTTFVAPSEPGPVTIACQITLGDETISKRLHVEVVTQAAEQPGIVEAGNSETIEPTGQTTPPGREPYDISQGGFIPGGWMGDGEKGTKYLKVERLSKEKPHSPPTCQKWSYRPGGPVQWAAVAWQFPDKNWGDKPGRNLKGHEFTRVSIWARGLPDKDGKFPLVQFKAGGNTDPSKKYQASFEVEGEFEKLTQEWKRYTLDLRGQDLSNVVSAFCFAVRLDDNPNGAVFFLDDITYEK